MLSVEKDVATLALNRSTQEIRRGDRLLPEEERAINANFFPSAPEQDIQRQAVGGAKVVYRRSAR